MIGTGIVWAKDPTAVCLRETWSVAKQDNNPIGFGVDQLWKTKDGYLYTADATLQLTFLGSNPSKVTQHFEMAVESNYVAKSCLAVVDINGSRTQIKAEFGKEQIKVTTTTADGKEIVEIQKIDKPVYFAASVLDLIIKRDGLKTGSKYKADIWDIGTMKPLEYLMAVNQNSTYSYGGKEIPVVKITERTDHETFSYIDEKGTLYSGYDPKMKIFFYRCEKDEIPELKAMTADVLIIPGNMKITFPFRSVSSQIKINWESVDFKDFDLNDNRQKLIKHTNSSGKQEAIVEIRRDNRSFKGKMTLPVIDKTLTAYLADVEYISPSSPVVRKLSAQILNGEKDGWLATQKLTKWVYEYINPSLIPETLTTEQILERKTGKCVEYAVLFASLARAAGLPTKVVMGERYQDNMWIGHLWNEVWLGEWVTIDASHNQVAPDALLLKLAASDAIKGMQKVRNGLIGELDIEIIDVQQETMGTNQKSGLKTGITGQVYTNADFKCRMEIPEGWQLMETQEQGLPELVAQNLNNPLAIQVLVMFSVPQGTTPEQMLKARIPMLKNVLPDFKLLKEEKVKMKAYSTSVGTWEFSHSGKKIKQQNWILVQGDRGFLLVFQASGEEWSKYEVEFQKMREQFVILE